MSKIDPDITSKLNIPLMVAKDNYPMCHVSSNQLPSRKKGGKRYKWDRKRDINGTSVAYDVSSYDSLFGTESYDFYEFV